MVATAHSTFNLEKLLKEISDQKFPPVEKWNPEFCGDIDMRIAVDGTWFYMGTPIARERMVRLFSTVLRKDSDGKTYLVTPVEKIGITVDDAPFLATQLDVVGEADQQILSFSTNVGDKVVASKENPIRVEIDAETEEPRPYILVRGNLEALIARSVFYELVDRATEKKVDSKSVLTINSSGESFSLGSWSDTA
ncbi:MAG: DUF1285 domain-containing protein [Kordiimonadaceae bacterium]|nr:DUF1285 domain-containing protein [Kordiimonadaceae bacterium]